MYLEFLLLISDYFKTLTRKIFLYEWIVPLVFSILLFLFKTQLDTSILKSFKDSAISILGVLLGFSIAVITIITTGSGENLEKIKKIKTEFKIGIHAISLYKLTLINFTYSVVMEILVIVPSITLPILSNCINPTIKLFLYILLVFGVIHILLLTLRNLTDFYLIIAKEG